MSNNVNIFEPSTQAVTLTPAAISYIRKELQRQNAVGMHLGVKRSGCSGLAYVVDYVLEPAVKETDLAVRINDEVVVYIDKQSLPYIYGTQLDCVRNGLNTSLTFTNPNQKGSCGCGESFMI